MLSRYFRLRYADAADAPMRYADYYCCRLFATLMLPPFFGFSPPPPLIRRRCHYYADISDAALLPLFRCRRCAADLFRRFDYRYDAAIFDAY